MRKHLSGSNEPGIIREPGVVGSAEEFIAKTDFHVPVQGEFDSALLFVRVGRRLELLIELDQFSQ